MTSASAGRSSACSTPASTTPRSRSARGQARRRSPASPRGSTTAKGATARCWTSWRRALRPARTPTPSPAIGEPPAMTDPATGRLRLAIPNKGRMVEPTLRLLHDAGLVFEEHDRSLVARVQNFELDILFVRTNDVIEFVGDGVADLGITGLDLLAETGAGLLQFRALGYGRCRLAAAVANDSAYRALEDLAGVRVATAHPNTARRFF